MVFPEELDNRTFRVFVQRTSHLIKNNLALSATEKRLAELLQAYPELGFLSAKSDIDITVQYSETELNPFLILSALWQVRNQLRDDAPKGYRNIVDDAFNSDMLDADDLLVLAEIYLTLYLRAREDGMEFTEKDYLYEVQYYLNNLSDLSDLDEEMNYPDNYQDDEVELVAHSVFDDLFHGFVQAMHEEASSKPVTIHSKLGALLNKMPSPWVNAITDFWEIPDERLKRDRVKNIVKFLTDETSVPAIREALAEDEKEALAILTQHDGYVKYNTLARKFGDEYRDSYWWDEDPPRSLIGRLRMMGLAAVGKAPLGSRQYKIILIPKDVRHIVAMVLKE